MLLPDMFDEKVALMSQEAELSESRTTEQGTLIALSSAQMVTLFTTGLEGRGATAAPVEVVLDDAKGAVGEKVSITFFTPQSTWMENSPRFASIISQLVSSYMPRGTRTTSVRSWPTGRKPRAKHERGLYQASLVTPSEGDRGLSASRVSKHLFHKFYRGLL